MEPRADQEHFLKAMMIKNLKQKLFNFLGNLKDYLGKTMLINSQLKKLSKTS
jgi:hypothetical protein